MGEELRARGEEEGSWSEQEEGVERTRRGGRFCRQPGGVRKSARGRPAPPCPRPGPTLAPRLPCVRHPGVGVGG